MDKGCNCTGSEQSHTGTLDIKKIKDNVSKPALKAHAKHVLCVQYIMYSLWQIASYTDYFVFEANFMEGTAHAEPINILSLFCSTQGNQT